MQWPGEDDERTSSSEEEEEELHSGNTELLCSSNWNDSGGVFRLAGKIQGRDAVLLKDSGATSQFMSTELAKELGLFVTPSNRAIRLANGSTTRAAGTVVATCELSTVLGKPFRFSEKFYVTDLAGYDAILGMEWLKRFNPAIDWSERTLALRLTPDAPLSVVRPIQGCPPQVTKECNVITVSQLGQMRQDGQIAETFAFMVRDFADTAPDLQLAATTADRGAPAGKSEVEALLEEFKDVLPKELPAGLPPKRGVEHAIELVEGSRPPAAPLRRYSPLEDA